MIRTLFLSFFLSTTVSTVLFADDKTRNDSDAVYRDIITGGAAKQESGIHQLMDSAKNHDAKAIYLLADCYRHGIIVRKDVDKAFRLYKESAELGDLNAAVDLAFCYLDGTGTQTDKQLAFKILESASAKKDEIAIGSIIHFANVFELRNDQIATYKSALFDAAKQRADDGSYSSSQIVSQMYSEAGSPFFDKKAADKYRALSIVQLEKQASEGKSDALYWLAWDNEFGNSRPKNQAQAIVLYRQAFDHGSGKAASRLAFLFREGEAGIQDQDLAHHWSQVADRVAK